MASRHVSHQQNATITPLSLSLPCPRQIIVHRRRGLSLRLWPELGLYAFLP